jgi:hypothetical protein
MRDFATQIYVAVRDGRLIEPFGPDDVKRACPCWAPATYAVLLTKHRVGNPEGNASFPSSFPRFVQKASAVTERVITIMLASEY